MPARCKSPVFAMLAIRERPLKVGFREPTSAAKADSGATLYRRPKGLLHPLAASSLENAKGSARLSGAHAVSSQQCGCRPQDWRLAMQVAGVARTREVVIQ